MNFFLIVMDSNMYENEIFACIYTLCDRFALQQEVLITFATITQIVLDCREKGGEGGGVAEIFCEFAAGDTCMPL